VELNVSRPAEFSGFVHAQAGQLVDGLGAELQLRGVGLGNWLLPEGYMWKFGPGAESPREIEALVIGLLGDTSAKAFWNDFQDTYISKEDIAKIASSGFDHVRLPINSRVVMTEEGLPIEAGFALIDRVIEWCREHRIWVLLDLHGAPGGQTGTNIDDSPNDKPELFMDSRYWDQTLELWRLIATRYSDETVVLGYDLLNEPLPNGWQYEYVAELSQLYRELTQVIRAVDTNHLIVYEGTHWATNWDLFTEVWDANSMLQFHKYWSAPDTASIQKFLDARDRLGLPIYMGESGENNLEWLYTAFRLYEAHGIGWNFWPWKKMETITSPVSVLAPLGWEEIRNYAHGGERVPREKAQVIFDQLLINMRTENSIWHPQIVAALLANNPVVIPGWGFGFRGSNQSYSTKRAIPLAGMRSNDLVTIDYFGYEIRSHHNFEQNDGRDYTDAEQLIVRLNQGEWLEYEVSPQSDIENLVVDTCTPDPTSVSISRSERGFRITAERAVGILRMRLTS
jgi:endoglucanase